MSLSSAWNSGLAVTLSVLLLASPCLNGQTPSAGKKPAKNQGKTVPKPRQGLTVFVLEGNGATNFIPDGKSLTPVIEIRDENEIPVESADVVFELPETGPGGAFLDGKRIKTFKTNSEGQVGAPFTINAIVGAFQIKVSATAGDRKGSAIISQSNSLDTRETVARKKKPLYKNWKVWAAVGAAAGVAVAVVILTTGSSTSAATNPTVIITPGGPVFGGPK